MSADFNLIYKASSGNHLYKYGSPSHLLRTPLYRYVSLAPDRMAWYSVAGSYSNDWPTGGVVSTNMSNVWENTINSGKLMRRYYLGNNIPSGFNQIWHGVNTGHEPEFVFYQGNYNTSASNSTSAHFQGSAYMQIPAYHFTLPSDGWRAVGGTLRLTVGGEIIEYGSPQSSQSGSSRSDYNLPQYCSLATTDRIPTSSEFRSKWTQRMGVYSSLNNSMTSMHNDYTQEVEIDTNKSLSGGQNDDLCAWEKRSGYSDYYWWKRIGTRTIWSWTGSGGPSYCDGTIPVSPNPWVQSIDLNASSMSKLVSLGGGWIVITPSVSVSNGYEDNASTDAPFYYPTRSQGYYWWLCSSYWGFSLRLTMEL